MVLWIRAKSVWSQMMKIVKGKKEMAVLAFIVERIEGKWERFENVSKIFL